MSSEKLKGGLAALTAVTLASPLPARADDEAALCSWRDVGDLNYQRCKYSEDGRTATCVVAEGKNAQLGVRHAPGWTVQGGTSILEYSFATDLKSGVSLTKDQVALGPGNHSIWCRNSNAPTGDDATAPSPPGAGDEDPNFVELTASVLETDQNLRTGMNESERVVADETRPEVRVGLGVGGATVGRGARPAGLLEASFETVHRRGTTGARSLLSGGLDLSALFGQTSSQREIFQDAAGNVVREVAKDTRFGLFAAGLFARIAGDSDFGLQLSLQAGANTVAEKGEGRFAVLGKGELEIPLVASSSREGLRFAWGSGARRIRSETRLNLGLQALAGTVGDHGFWYIGGGVTLRR